MSSTPTPSDAPCVICGAADLTSVVDVDRAPVFINQLCHSKQQAEEAPVALIELVFCERCGHLFNRAFDPERLAYSPEYENSLHFSGKFQEYADGLVVDLQKRYGLSSESSVVEVGCGRGDFLASLCGASGARGFGFDPSCPPNEMQKDVGAGVTISQEFYSEEHASLEPDLLCSRHCLEHVSNPVDFLKNIRQALRPGTPVFFEVPNALFTLRDGGVWDIIYEHPHYFTPDSLAIAFERAGYEVKDVGETFGGQFLTIHTVVREDAPESTRRASDELLDHVAVFRRGYEDTLSSWSSRLEDADRSSRAVVAWGAGSKGSTFFNTFRAHGSLRAAVDINPRKQGKFIAGSGHPILSPEELKAIDPATVIVMNPLYVEEVKAALGKLSLTPEVIGA